MKSKPAAQSGLSLVESLVSTCVLAVTCSLAVPGLDGAVQRRHTEGVAAQFETDVHYTRSLAVARGHSLRIGFGDACYVIHTGSAGQCRCSGAAPAQCSAGAEALRQVQLPAGGALRLASSSASMLFDADQGTVTPTATVRLSTADGAGLHAVVNLMGRVRTCSPGATLPGYPAC